MNIHFGIYQAGKAHATRCSNGNLSLPPSGGGRLGWGWLFLGGLGQIKFVPPVESLSHQTGEGQVANKNEVV